MLEPRITLFTKLKLSLLIPVVVLFTTNASANDTSVDLDILKQADTLVPYMTAEQKMYYLALEAELDSARSNLRSGKHLANTKASRINPDRDPKPIIDRGMKLVLESQAIINTKRVEIAQHLLDIREKKAQKQAADITRYDYSLVSSDLDSALANHSRKLLDTCWKLGYETLFFHTAFLNDLTLTQEASEPIRNRAYRALTQADGSRFSVSIPMNLVLNHGRIGEGTEIFSYENSDLFEGEKKALLAIELIIPKGSSTGLLSMRAIDLCTQQIVAHELIKILDISEAMNFQEEDHQDYLSDKVRLRNPSRTIEVLAKLSTPYIFELATAPSMAAVKEQLTHTLIKHSKLKIVASDFIKRNYDKAIEEVTSYKGPANATITLEATDKEGTYQVNAKANKRSLSIGLLTL